MKHLRNSKKRLYWQIIPVLMAVISAIINLSCQRNHSNDNNHGNNIDTLRVVTLYSPTSFFDYRGEFMGIDYENVKRFAEEEGMVLDVRPVNNISQLIVELKEGRAHLAAYPVPSISEYNEEIIHCGPVEVSHQVLVQKKGADKITDVIELIGKDIYVEKDSKYQFRLENLNDELGGGINIHTIVSDTLDTEDFFHMVNKEEIPYTVIDSQLANLYGPSYPSLDFSLPLSADQSASWAVAIGLDSLASKINRWENISHSSEFVKSIYKRYYDRTLSEDFDANLTYFKKLNLRENKTVSKFDGLFKTYAPSTGYDWKLLAAIAYCESNYNPSVESRFGAKGLMQVMPKSARAVGVDPGSLGSPDQNVKAASKILKKLDDAFKNKVQDPEERMKFVIASYNSGLGHIYDAMALAEKIGLDSGKWNGNVSITALMKSRPEYYNDPVVKHGYFRGRETVDFVDHVTGIYHFLERNIQS